MTYACAAEIRRNVSVMLRPPARITVSAAAASVLRMDIPGGYKGPWDPALVPYMPGPMDELTNREVEGIVFVGPAQSGKTFALVGGAIVHTMVYDPADMLLIHMSQDTARDFSRKEIDRWIRHSDELKSRLSPRPRDDNTYDKFFKSGAVLKIGWPSISQLSGKSVRVVVETDYDRYPLDIDGEGGGFPLGRKRVTAFMSRGKCVAEGSPGYVVTNPKWRRQGKHEAPPCEGILALYNTGDRRRWYWPCPSCGEYFEATPGILLFSLPPEDELLERLRTEEPTDLADKFSLVECPACHTLIDETNKREMNARGRWLAEGQTIRRDGRVEGAPRGSNIASFWLGGVAAAFISWPALVLRHLQALKTYVETGDQTSLKVTENTDQGIPHTRRGAHVDAELSDLQTRAEEWMKEHVPLGVRFLIASVDVQRGRFVVQVHGYGAGLEEWIVDRYTLKSSERYDSDGKPEQLDPSTYSEDWDRLVDKVLDRKYPLGDGSGRMMPIYFVAIDSGGEEGVTQRAYEFWRRQQRLGRGKKFRLVKGFMPDPKAKKPSPRVEETYPDVRGRKDRNSGARGDVPLVLINTLVIKDAVAGDLMKASPGPGYLHFPKWLPSEVYAELTSETRTLRGWSKPHGVRNEAFDLAVYARAMTILVGAERIKWDVPPGWAAPWDLNPLIESTGAPVRAKGEPSRLARLSKLLNE